MLASGISNGSLLCVVQNINRNTSQWPREVVHVHGVITWVGIVIRTVHVFCGLVGSWADPYHNNMLRWLLWIEHVNSIYGCAHTQCHACIRTFVIFILLQPFNVAQ